ncbi:MAG TPA: 4-vinyl reductase [Patescibacteria group bacterium]|nr:4-vinyl reductase [Patescibacteria group bacterium]
MTLSSVKVPEEMAPLFEQAEKYVKDYYDSFKSNKKEGTITIGGERYILVRAKSLRVDFAEHLGEALGLPAKLAAEASDNFLYILARAIGKADAKHFVAKQGVTEPIAKLAAGPISFNYSGWALVDIFPESKPTPDENYFLTYDHPYSFEADAYISAKGAASPKPVCVMNAGYSAGWCSESFGVEVDAREIMCRAKGDQACRFVMGLKARLDEYEQWTLKNVKR